jgi:beta-1,2-mannobiose phosphorylase / 1,2-beta-oligomannan phosphorylase
MIFIGDGWLPGGIDYPAKGAGVVSIQVRDPQESKRVIEAILACLHCVQHTKLREEDSMSGFQLQRLGQIMEPEAGNPLEAEGVSNPAAVRGPDGELYLFPRLVARGNYSRIGIARVRFNEAGDPAGVERLGIALEPEADYERRSDGSCGCEDPRITFIEPLKRYVMTYTAYSPRGPRIALAISDDLFHWERMGLAIFMPYDGVDFNDVDNKDGLLFPVAIPDVAGQPAMAIIHRPLFLGTGPDQTILRQNPRDIDVLRESIWISYHSLVNEVCDKHHHLCHFDSHERLAIPVAAWEQLKIGGGAPPILTQHGWLVVYHGVSETAEPGNDRHALCYSAGVMVLSKEHPRVIRYRSTEPVLTPLLAQERSGIVPNVVFPTGLDRRDDLGSPNRIDVYYGMADSRIGVARLDVPEHLPQGHSPTLGSKSLGHVDSHP